MPIRSFGTFAGLLALMLLSTGCMLAPRILAAQPPGSRIAKIARGEGPLGLIHGSGPIAHAAVQTSDASPPQEREEPAATREPPARARAPEEQFYSLEFVLTASDENGLRGTESYVLVAQDGHASETKFGSSTPMSVVAKAPLRVGTIAQIETKIATLFEARPDGAIVDFNLETSTSAQASRQLHMKGRAWVASGHPVVVASFDQERTHYQLTLTATKVR